jgi:hypothetical protein
MKFSHRIAAQSDIPAIIDLMRLAIEENMKAYISREEIEAAKETMGMDQTLIDDGSYFLIEAELESRQVLVGCGGWGKRRTLYGGNHTKGRDDSLSDPATEAARIRAMYTHPEWTRPRYWLSISSTERGCGSCRGIQAYCSGFNRGR